MIGIHKLHRQMAFITAVNINKNGILEMGMPELMLLMPLLLKNYKLVSELDALKELAFHAHEMGDMEWQQDICKQIEELEAQLV
ncbi:hypothetical protein [Paenibacillus sp. S150]|uniref:DUF7667 family protein n=1 Tax=Paenibacillus sp. S150 TaxID=2749826 RepID=UPI001C582A21|nr:hypothetical protein [Paenibacillus sp. S150]MBW4083573.1 hypothetical protein [Paenibacillus sp. S150]